MPFYGLAGQLIFLPGRAGPFFLPTPVKSGYCHAGARQKNSRPPEIVFMGCMDVFHKMYKCMPRYIITAIRKKTSGTPTAQHGQGGFPRE